MAMMSISIPYKAGDCESSSREQGAGSREQRAESSQQDLILIL